jgi:hypothetical protein
MLDHISELKWGGTSVNFCNCHCFTPALTSAHSSVQLCVDILLRLTLLW